MEKTFVEKLGSQLTVSHRLRKYHTGALTVDWRIYRTILNLRPIEIFVLQISSLAKGVRTVRQMSKPSTLKAESWFKGL